MSRGGPRRDEWRLHPDIVRLIWQRFGTAQVVRVQGEQSLQVVVLSQPSGSFPVRGGCVGAHTLAGGSLVCISSAPADPPSSGTGQTGEIVPDYSGSGEPLSSVVSRAGGALTDGAVAGTVQIGCAFTGPRDSAPPT